MKLFVKMVLLWTLFYSGKINAQQLNFKLTCPLYNAIIDTPSAKSIHLDMKDLFVTLTSTQDTIVKAGFDAQVTNIETDDEGKYEVVLFAKINGTDYFLWYNGLSGISVPMRRIVKAGQPIGNVNSGDRIGLRLYDFETPVNLMLFLDCKEKKQF